jgi:hypothetical protein
MSLMMCHHYKNIVSIGRSGLIAGRVQGFYVNGYDIRLINNSYSMAADNNAQTNVGELICLIIFSASVVSLCSHCGVQENKDVKAQLPAKFMPSSNVPNVASLQHLRPTACLNRACHCR